MRLTDIMSHANLAVWPIVAMVLFIAIFAGVVLYVVREGQRGAFDRLRTLPLDDTPSTGETSHE